MSSSERPKKNDKWIRARHRIICDVFRYPFYLFLKLKCGLTADRFNADKNGPHLILFNHQTVFDQFFVSISFHCPVYYLATEDIFSNGLISSLLRWSVAPIPIKKNTNDLHALRTMMKVAREGGTIAIAPEGNRTYSGKTEYMNPSIANMAKALHMPIVLYRIEGGYGVQPRWGRNTRRGRIHAYVSRVIRPEETDTMSREELAAQIREGLYVNEANSDSEYISSQKAEYLERAFYVCPDCGPAQFSSCGNETECLKCHKKIRYNSDKSIEGVGFEFPFRYADDWYEYQKAFVNRLDLTQFKEAPLFCDRADISEVIVYKKKERLRKNAAVSLYGDRIVIDEGTENEWVLPFEELSSAAVLGRNKLNVYHKGKIYQFRSDMHFNALKYVNILYRYRNMTEGDKNGEFLGL